MSKKETEGRDFDASLCSSSSLIKNEINKAQSGRYDALWDDDRTEGYIAGLERALELLEPEWESLPESTGGFFVGWDNSEPPQLWVWRGEPGDETAEAWQKIEF